MGRAAGLMAVDDEIGHFEQVLINITLILMILSFILVGIALYIMISRGNDLLDSIAFCVVLLVASIPIATPVVANATMALGSRALSKEGALVTRLAAIEEVAGMDMLCSDKTGTLTIGFMEMCTERIPFSAKYSAPYPPKGPGNDDDDILLHAVLGADWCTAPSDHIDTLLLFTFEVEHFEDHHATEEAKKDWPQLVPGLAAATNRYVLCDHTPFDPNTKKTVSLVYDSQENELFVVTKGAQQVIMDMVDNKGARERPIFAEFWDNLDKNVEADKSKGTKGTWEAIKQSLEANGYKRGSSATVRDVATEVNNVYALAGTRCLSVCRSQSVKLKSNLTPPTNGVEPAAEELRTAAKKFFEENAGAMQWDFVGMFTFRDPARHDTPDTIKEAREDYHVQIKMITGDNIKIARTMGAEIGLGSDREDPFKGSDTCDIGKWESAPLECDENGRPKVPTDLGEKFGDLVLSNDGFAEVLPEHKFLIVETFKQMTNERSGANFQVGMTGCADLAQQPRSRYACICLACQAFY